MAPPLKLRPRCIRCGTVTKALRRKFCSGSCSKKTAWEMGMRGGPPKGPRIERACEYCGKIFLIRPSRPVGRFCSITCSKSIHGKSRTRDYFAVQKRNNKAKRKKAVGRHTVGDIVKILKRQDGRCVYCKTDIKKRYHVDHIIPLTRGGTNWPDNLQLLCPSCNLRKSSKKPELFANEMGLLL
jgi:5-methylcytosine-specific restriction endonuclease McrA